MERTSQRQAFGLLHFYPGRDRNSDSRKLDAADELVEPRKDITYIIWYGLQRLLVQFHDERVILNDFLMIDLTAWRNLHNATQGHDLAIAYLEHCINM